MTAGIVAASGVLSTSYMSQVLADSPLAYYRLGEASGTTMADSSGNARNGTYSASPTLGVAGALTSDTDTAITLNGSTQSGTVTFASWMNTTAELTLEAWIKTTVGGIVIGRAETGGVPYYLWAHPTLGLYFQIQHSSGSVAAWYDVPAAILDGQWHHVAGTYKQSPAAMRVYLDSVDVTNQGSTLGGQALTTNSNGLYIGRRGGGQFFSGSIDEAAIYGTALSATRIAAHYAAR